MNNPVVIVDPLDGGAAFAPCFKRHGVPAIAVTLKNQKWAGFNAEVRSKDYIKIIPEDANLLQTLKKYSPRAIIPGTEEGVGLAEKLTSILTPEYANDPTKSLNRQHKALMQDALKKANIPVLKTLNTASLADVNAWIKANNFLETPLIIKPPISSGSDKVFHIPPGSDWKKAFNRVLNEPAAITRQASDTVVVQEEAMGTEFAVGTVSVNGNHHLAHLIKYHKLSVDGRKTIFDYVEFVPFEESIHGELLTYTKKALDALGVYWGAAHNEVMLTKNGPRLIETGIRICGGPVTRFAREATHSSQVDKLVEAYTYGKVFSNQYVLKKTVVPVFLKSPASGQLLNLAVFDEVKNLSTLIDQFIWVKNNDYVPQTVDYLTSIGIVALAGERDAIFKDYQSVRDMESRLIVRQMD